MKIKIISFIVTFSVIFSIIAFPANATAAVKSNIIDLMSDTYEFYWQTSYSEPVKANSFYFSPQPSSWISVTWDLPDMTFCNQIFFTLEADVLPTDVRFSCDNDFGNQPVKWVGSDGSFHNFSITGTGYLSKITLKFEFVNSYQGNLSLYNCFSYQKNASFVSSINLEGLAEVYEPNSIARVTLPSVRDNLPVTSSSKSLSYNPDFINWFVVLNESHFAYSAIDTITFYITYVGSLENFSLSIINKDTGSYIGQAPLISVGEDSTYKSPTVYFGSPPLTWPMTTSCVTFDLSGYSLDEYKITFECESEGVPIKDIDTAPYGYYFSMRNIVYYPVNPVQPWYTRLFQFLNYHFTEIRNYLSQFFGNVVNSISSWGQNIVTSISSWGQNIVNALTGTNSDAQDALDQSGHISGELGDVNQEMNDLNKIDPDQINPDINVVVPGGLSSSYTGFLAAIFQNPIIYQVISISLLISFAGYVLYGKR